MSIFNKVFKDARTKRLEKAADQMFQALLTGFKFEVPQTLSKDDDTVAAVILLRKRHPDVTVSMLQNKGIVLSRGNAAKAAMASATWNILDAHGYFPDAKYEADTFLASHEAFMNRNAGGTEGGKEFHAERQAENAVVL